MATYHEFNQEEVQALIDAAAAHHDMDPLAASPNPAMFHASPMKIGDTCISVTVENGKVCLNLPVVKQKVCFPIPAGIPDGTAAQACLKICTTWKIPSGVCVTISVLGKQVIHQCFGSC